MSQIAIRTLLLSSFWVLCASACQIDLVADTESSTGCTTSADCPEGQICDAFVCTQTSSSDPDGDFIYAPNDNCPDTANSDQADLDGDLIGDVCDDDRDGDAVLNDTDNCPDISNTEQTDSDRDQIGDACDDETTLWCDCTDLQICGEETDGLCTNGSVCLADIDCSDGQSCIDSTCRVDDRACLSDSDCTDGFCNSAYVCVPNVCGADAECPEVCDGGVCGECNEQAPALGIRNAAVASASRAQPAAMIQTVLANVSVVTADVVKTQPAAKIRSNQTMSSQPPQRYLKAPKRLSSVPPSMMGPG